MIRSTSTGTSHGIGDSTDSGRRSRISSGIKYFMESCSPCSTQLGQLSVRSFSRDGFLKAMYWEHIVELILSKSLN